MSDSKKPIGLMVRLPPDLHAAIAEYAKGSESHAATSLNNTMVFLLRAGLATVEKGKSTEKKPGQMTPALQVAA